MSGTSIGRGNMIDTAPYLDAIREAAAALRGVVTRTPLLESPEANAHLPARLLVKAECAQRTGAFKIRGAYNRIRQMSAAEKACGVITYSSGNHAQGVALAARLLGTTALIVMPSDVAPAKQDGALALGAQIVTFDRDTEDYNEVVSRLGAETGRINVPPSGDARVLAGAGTVALELYRQAQEMHVTLDAVLVPCGGGGLTAATALVMHALSPRTRVFAVEPALFDDTRRSLAAGTRLSNPRGRQTICDGIMSPTPNAETFEVNRRLLAGGLAVSDDEVRDAMLFAHEHYELVIEPAGAVGIAAVLGGQPAMKAGTFATIATGGNIAPDDFARTLDAARTRARGG